MHRAGPPARQALSDVHHFAGPRRHNGRIAPSRPEIEALIAGVDLDAMVLLPPRPAWWAEAACRDHPEVNFFPEQGQSAAPAKAVCAACPAKEACLAFAIDEQVDQGIFGGQSAIQRRRARAGMNRARKASPVGAGRWRERPPPVDLDALATQAAGWRRNAAASRAKRAG